VRVALDERDESVDASPFEVLPRLAARPASISCVTSFPSVFRRARQNQRPE
jgi:hypothetical protein